MNTEALVEAVIARLSAAFTSPIKAHVIPWPDDPKSKVKMTAGKVEMWVAYEGSTFGDPEAIDHPIQNRSRRVSVALFTRNLQSTKANAAWVDAVHEVLHGFAVGDGRRLTIEQDRFGSFEDGIWRYDLVYRAMATQIPIIGGDNAQPGPALRYLMLADTVGGDSEIQSTTPEEP